MEPFEWIAISGSLVAVYMAVDYASRRFVAWYRRPYTERWLLNYASHEEINLAFESGKLNDLLMRKYRRRTKKLISLSRVVARVRKS